MSVILVLPTLASTIFFVLKITTVANRIVSAQILLLVLSCPVMYFRIFKTVKQSTEQVQNNTSQSRHRQQQQRMTKKLVVIVIVLFICYTPYGIISSIKDDKMRLRQLSSDHIALAFISINSLFNPFLFLWQDSVLRKVTIAFLRNILYKIVCQKVDQGPASSISSAASRSQRVEPSRGVRESEEKPATIIYVKPVK